MQINELWQNVLAEIELNISRANFITWFKNTKISSKKDGLVVISVPNGFTKEWLENKYRKLILKLLRNQATDIKDIRFVIGEFKEEKKKKKKEVSGFIPEQLDFKEFKVDKETNLNPRYTFDTFVVGSFNELAQAAGRALIKRLGNLYNPFFVYGGVGLGKTHLLQAIGNELIKKYPHKKIKYLSSEKYTSELVDAISKKGMDSFKQKYHKTDVLIIDDIQFIAGKEKTQEEFFHTFNALYQNNKQIIISSDRPPKAIPTLEERLRSRFEGGMIADISYPDLETRIAILKSKAKEKGIEIPAESLDYIANQIQSNIRELEGALNRIIAAHQINQIPINLTNVKKLLSKNILNKARTTNLKTIFKIVSGFYDIEVKDLVNRSRKKEVIKPRQIAMYLIRKELKGSFPYIGEKLGGRDHTTVMYACQKIENNLQNDEGLKEELNLIKEQLYNR